MEYPDKDESPLLYIQKRFGNTRKCTAPSDEKEWAHKICGEVYAYLEAQDKCDDLYIIDVVDAICNLVESSGTHEEYTGIVIDLFNECRRFREKMCEMQPIIDNIKKMKDTLESKVTLKEIIKEMKRAN
jgi:hypothetical protein